MEVDGRRLDDGIVSELCEPCKEGNVSKQADGYCIDCEEHMCQTCFQRHLKLKLCRNHVLGAVDAGHNQGTQSPAEKYKKHETENIKYYCHKHDSVACGDCLLFDHRKCEPEPEFIRNLAKNIEESSDFKNILYEVERLEEFKTEIELALGRNRNENTMLHNKAIHGIQKCRAEVNTWLDDVTSKIEAKETEIWKENEIMLSKLEDGINIINDKIDEIRDEISYEKFTAKFEFMQSANLGLIRLSGGNIELQTSNVERQYVKTCIDGLSNAAPSNLTGPEAEDVGVCEIGSLKRSEDSLRAKLEKELKRITETTFLDKEQREKFEKTCITLKKELEDQGILLSREREERQKCIIKTSELENTIVLLKQENSSFNDLNISLKSQLESCINEFEPFVYNSKARQVKDQTEIKSLQAELKKISESHQQEHESLSSQIRDLQRQRVSAEKTYQLPDPRAAGFDVGTRVEYTGPLRWLRGDTATVTSVDPSGYVDVKWDDGGSGRRYKAGAGGQYHVKLL